MHSSLLKIPARLRVAAVRAANFSLIVLCSLAHGEIAVEPEPVVGSYSRWSKAGLLGREVSLRVLEQTVDDWAETGDFVTGEGQATRSSDRLAFRKLTSKIQNGYEQSQSAGSSRGVDAKGRPVLVAIAFRFVWPNDVDFVPIVDFRK